MATADASGNIAGALDGLDVNSIIRAIQGAFGAQVDKSGNSNTLTSGTSSSSSSQNQLLTQLMTALTQQTGTSDTTGSASKTGSSSAEGSSSSISPLALQTLQGLIPNLQDNLNNSQYTRENAIKDSQGGVQNILKTLQEQSLPQVYQAENVSGGYNSTVKAQMSNDLTARAVGQASALQSSNIASYANIQNQQQSSLLNAVKLATDALQNKTGTQTGTTNESGVNNSSTNTSQNTLSTTNNSVNTDTTSNKVDTNQSQTNTATVDKTNTQGILNNSGVQGAAGILAAISGLSGIAGVPGLSGLLTQLTNMFNPSGNETPIPNGITDPGAGGGMDFGGSSGDGTVQPDLGTGDLGGDWGIGDFFDKTAPVDVSSIGSSPTVRKTTNVALI